MASSPTEFEQSRRISGRWIVLGMFVFGLTAVGLLYLYWNLHTAPFLPLQQALSEAFPDSAPRVEGGQRKKHEDTPRMLRITMKVAENPNSPEADERIGKLGDQVLAVARNHASPERYDLLEIHFFWPEPEKEIQQRTLQYSLKDSPQRLPDPQD